MRRTATMAWATVIAAMALASCSHSSGGQWENPNKPWEQWSADETECRDLARTQAEQDFNPRATPGQAPASTSTGRTATDWLDMMDRYSAQRQEDTLFQRCMLQRGYRLVPRANPA